MNPNLSYMWWAQFWAVALILLPLAFLVVSEGFEMVIRHFFNVSGPNEEDELEQEETSIMKKYAAAEPPLRPRHTQIDPQRPFLAGHAQALARPHACAVSQSASPPASRTPPLAL